MDRMACTPTVAIGTSTSTHGKNVAEAKSLELDRWPYPRHLTGPLCATVVHGDTAGAETLRRINVGLGRATCI